MLACRAQSRLRFVYVLLKQSELKACPVLVVESCPVVWFLYSFCPSVKHVQVTCCLFLGIFVSVLFNKCFNIAIVQLSVFSFLSLFSFLSRNTSLGWSVFALYSVKNSPAVISSSSKTASWKVENTSKFGSSRSSPADQTGTLLCNTVAYFACSHDLIW